MTVALIDNGSLQPAAHRNLRALAATLAERTGIAMHAVSWKHSDRIRPLAFQGPEPGGRDCPVPLQPNGRAWILPAWIRAQLEAGESEFRFVPFFVSGQGAIGSALRDELENLQRKFGGFAFAFTRGLAVDELARIAAARIREVIDRDGLRRPPVIVVDHGGPSVSSAKARDEVAAAVRRQLGSEIGPLAAASLEGGAHPHNHPLLGDQLGASNFDRGEVVIAPLFLAPGRHAGPRGDLAQVARAAEDRLGSPALRCHFAELVGTHPLATEALVEALRDARLNPAPQSALTLDSAPENSLSSLLPTLSSPPFPA